MDIIELSDDHHDEVVSYINSEWGTPIVTRGKIINIPDLPGFVAINSSKAVGAILYQINGDECEIVCLYSLIENQGIGSKLINSVIEISKEHNCSRVWLITTNDNTHAIRYYQKRGFNFKAVHENAFLITQKIKSEFGEFGTGADGLVVGIDDIPIKHELEFEFVL